MKHVSVHVSPFWATGASELVKPLNISKPGCYSNATKRNVCNTSSVSKLIKSLNLSNSTCKPVSNFVSDCQSAKPVCKLIDVNWKRPRERFVNKKNSHQHGFSKPFSFVNILIHFE